MDAAGDLVEHCLFLERQLRELYRLYAEQGARLASLEAEVFLLRNAVEEQAPARAGVEPGRHLRIDPAALDAAAGQPSDVLRSSPCQLPRIRS